MPEHATKTEPSGRSPGRGRPERVLPELTRYEYSDTLGTGTVAAGGVPGILIPPSAILIIYSIIVAANVVTMFAAADSPFGVTTEELKIRFGILALIVVELGLIAPPVGMDVFIISAQVPDVPMRQTFLGILPFFGAELVRVAVLVAFPALTQWLPGVLSG